MKDRQVHCIRYVVCFQEPDYTFDTMCSPLFYPLISKGFSDSV